MGESDKTPVEPARAAARYWTRARKLHLFGVVSGAFAAGFTAWSTGHPGAPIAFMTALFVNLNTFAQDRP